MKVISLTGSPRQKGNSVAAAKKAMDLFKKEGHETKEFHIRTMKIGPCTACMQCKTKGTCVIKDDFPCFMEKIQESDLFILAAPIYFGRVPGTVKNFIDRCFSLFDSELKSRLKGKKKCLFITISHAPAEAFAEEVNYLAKWFVDFMKFEKAEKVVIGKCADQGDLEARDEDLEKIEEACKRLL